MIPLRKKEATSTRTCILEALSYNAELASLGGTPQASKHVTALALTTPSLLENGLQLISLITSEK